MAIFTKSLTYLLFISLLSAFSCTPVPAVEPSPVITEAYPTAPNPNIGKLNVYAIRNDKDYTAYEGVYIKLFANYEAYLLEINNPKQNHHLVSLRTDRNGRASFGDWIEGNYILWVTYQDGNNQYDNTFSVQIQGLKTVTRNIILR